MLLKSVELIGFKSFGKKTTLEFGSAIAAIVGPNGSGKCVAPDTLIQLASGERIPIRDLFDSAYATARHIKQYDDGVAVLASDFSAEVVSLDINSQKAVIRPVSAFIRRNAPEQLLTVTLRSGRTITATPYHPLFILENGAVRAARADALAKGVRVAAPRVIPMQGSLQRISMLDVLGLFQDKDRVYVPYATRIVEAFTAKQNTRSAVRIARSLSIPSESVQRWLDGQSLPSSFAVRMFADANEDAWFPDRILKSRTWGTIRVPTSIDENVARFLGYIISEGRNCKNGQIRFVNDDAPLVDDFVECARTAFSVSATVRSYKGRGIQDVFISSQTLSRFLERFFGIVQDGHSRDKRVPAHIFRSPHHIIAAFLSALFEGDAHLHTATPQSRANYLEYATASEELARDVAALLLRFGIRADVRPKIKRASNSIGLSRRYWSVFVYGNGQLATLGGVLRFRGRKSAALSTFQALQRLTNPNRDLLPGVASMVRSATKVAGVSVKKIRAAYPTLAAYCEGRCEASRAGVLRCIDAIERHGATCSAAAVLLTQLRAIATSDVLWDEVVSVDVVKGEGFVYDLTVIGDHNFIASEVFVHNSNVAEGFRFVLGEQSMKSMRSKRGEDLIWGGSPALPRANRGAVKVVFDNAKRLLDVDFSEVTIERVVHRDGVNEYLLNGSQVRLKDVIRLLAGAHIGGSGYQIISQGEADRILNASPKERREMVEDALGLKLYQHKKIESERKLEETGVNIDKTKSLRREIAPHLKFLGVQVEKIERARELREELAHKLADYLAREHAWLRAEETQVKVDAEEKQAAIRALREQLKEVRQESEGGKSEGGERAAHKLHEAEKQLADVHTERERLARELGRAEGALEAHAKERLVPTAHVRSFASEIEKALLDADKISDAGAIKQKLAAIRVRIHTFIEELFGSSSSVDTSHIEDLARALAGAEVKEAACVARVDEARRAIVAERELRFERQEARLRVEAALREAEGALVCVESKHAELRRLSERFREEVREGMVLVGEAVRGYEKRGIPEGALSEDRREQEKRRRDIERLKIKIEESGIGNSDAVVKEYTQTRDRYEFLGREVGDLEVSAAKLKDIIADLEETMDEKFTEGIARINEALEIFFTKLFGGGSAKLFVEKPRRTRSARHGAGPIDFDESDETIEVPDEDELYAGLNVSVSLPRKKVSGLEALSGGERALTSIALIFAISQVHPPPFLILDETDAALDEANSRRFADMIRELSRKSQLVVITHNRATMAAAGELYGVTMGSDGVSKLLSVKLEEAERVAK